MRRTTGTRRTDARHSALIAGTRHACYCGRMTWRKLSLAPFFIAAGISPAHAASLDGASMQWPWALPFAAMLLSIATGPLLFPRLWHHHYGKIALGWSALTLAALAWAYGMPATAAALIHALLAEYLSFIVLLFALYVIAGGILVSGILRGTPLVNTAVLGVGTLIASLVGTTGAAMILIRPLLRANEKRAHNTQVVVFFIILVANVGGALTPLGDPPLFVGFLRGVDFFWPAMHLWRQTLISAVLMLAMTVPNASTPLLASGRPPRLPVTSRPPATV